MDAPDRLRFLRTDVADEADVEALIGAATSTFHRLDVVFNNAGIGGAFGPITEIEVDHWDLTFAVLTRSVFLGIKHGARASSPRARAAASSTRPPSPAWSVAVVRRPTRQPRRPSSTSRSRPPRSWRPIASASTPSARA